jgi:nucleotide-binding universal stress UspA family protein
VEVRRVVTGLSGSAGSLQALRFAAEVARNNQALLAPVLAWTPPGGDLADRRYPCAPLRAAWIEAAWQRLWQAVDLAIGGPPADIEFSPQIVRGEPGPALTMVARQSGDMLVVGAGRHGPGRLFGCRTARYCLAHGACPVIAVPPSQLAAQAHGLRGWAGRRRLHPEDAVLQSSTAYGGPSAA